MNSRRHFLKVAGTGVLAAGATSLYAAPAFSLPFENTGNTFTLGMAGYTFREFNVEKTIEMMKRIGLTNLSLKDFHMPMNSTQEQINEILGKFKAAGINV